MTRSDSFSQVCTVVLAGKERRKKESKKVRMRIQPFVVKKKWFHHV